jgi:hypothetical protein
VCLATVSALALFTVPELGYLLAAMFCTGLSVSALWILATNRRARPWAGAGAAVFVTGSVACLVLAGRGIIAIALVTLGIALASVLGTLALRWEVGQVLAARWQRVPATRHGVLLVNPRSGDGKAARLRLVEEARRRAFHACSHCAPRPGRVTRPLAPSHLSQHPRRAGAYCARQTERHRPQPRG